MLIQPAVWTSETQSCNHVCLLLRSQHGLPRSATDTLHLVCAPESSACEGQSWNSTNTWEVKLCLSHYFTTYHFPSSLMVHPTPVGPQSLWSGLVCLFSIFFPSAKGAVTVHLSVEITFIAVWFRFFLDWACCDSTVWVPTSFLYSQPNTWNSCWLADWCMNFIKFKVNNLPLFLLSWTKNSVN